MKTTMMTAVVAFALAAAVAPASAQTAYSQLAANAGLSRSEAAGMTLEQIAAAYFNRGVSNQDRQTVQGEIVAGSAGDFARSQLRASHRDMSGASLREIAAIHSNRGMSNADKITVRAPTPGTTADRSQLAASAGLGLDGAEGRSLTEIAAIFFNRDESDADKQWVSN